MIFFLVSILLCSALFGVFWGPWFAVSRSMASFEPSVFVAITHRMDSNMGRPMTYLMPLTLLSIVPVLLSTVGSAPLSFALALAALACFVMTLVVTMAVEVPIVTRIRTWTPDALPSDWRTQRDRWVSFHLLRVGGGFLGLGLLVAAALW